MGRSKFVVRRTRDKNYSREVKFRLLVHPHPRTAHVDCIFDILTPAEYPVRIRLSKTGTGDWQFLEGRFLSRVDTIGHEIISGCHPGTCSIFYRT